MPVLYLQSTTTICEAKGHSSKVYNITSPPQLTPRTPFTMTSPSPTSQETTSLQLTTQSLFTVTSESPTTQVPITPIPTCGLPPVVSSATSVVLREVATYTCITGYKMTGSPNNMTCVGGQWIGYSPVCKFQPNNIHVNNKPNIINQIETSKYKQNRTYVCVFISVRIYTCTCLQAIHVSICFNNSKVVHLYVLHISRVVYVCFFILVRTYMCVCFHSSKAVHKYVFSYQ